MNLNRLKSLIGKKWFLVVIVALLTFGIFYLRSSAKNPNQTTIQTAAVERGTLVSSVTASGNISTGGSVGITTQASGVVSQVYVKNGDAVSQGQKIADILLDQTGQQKQAAAWSSYLSAQNSLNSAQAKLNSFQSSLFKANQAFLNDKGIANPSDGDKSDPKYIEENADWLQAEADYKNQQGVINQSQASLSNAWLAYQQASPIITAPISGTVNGLNLTPGLPIVNQATSNNTSATSQVGTIKVGQGKLQALVNLSQVDVVSVKPGQKVTLTIDAFLDKTFTGKVASIDINGVISSGVTNYPTTIDLDTTQDNIYPNMSVTAKIITLVKPDVLLIPSGAVQTQNGTSTVRVSKNGQVSTVTVETGESSDTQTEIISGLSEGDIVITGSTASSATSATTSPFGGGGFGILRTGGVGGGSRGR